MPNPDPIAAPDASLPVIRYSSSAQRPRDRYAAWREGSILSFGRMYDTAPTVPFATRTIVTQLGAIGFSHARMTAQEWHRTPAHLRQDGADPLMVGIRFAGSGRGDAAGRGFEAPPGCIVLSDFAQPQSYVSETASTALLSIPRAIAERVLPSVRSLHGIVIAPQTATLLRSHARSMVTAVEDGLPADQAVRLGRVMLDLLQIAVAQTRATGPIAPEAMATGTRLAAEAAIERHLGSATLTVDNLCRWTGTSRSALYRLFEAEGGIQTYIRNRRLDRIEEDLRRDAQVSLATLAERWLFADGSHLARAFRARHGQSPTDYRAGREPA